MHRQRHTRIMATHLDRLLFAQGNHCFFCNAKLDKLNASVEHLVASANGGKSDDGNCVACCKTLNQLLGAKSIKDKIQVILNQRGEFHCPGGHHDKPKPAPTQPAIPAPAPVAPVVIVTKPAPAPVEPDLTAAPDTILRGATLILENLRRRPSGRPAKLATLTKTAQSLLTQAGISGKLKHAEQALALLVERGDLRVEAGKVQYLF